MADVNVRVILEAVDNASSDIKNVGNSLNGLANSTKGLSGGLKTVGTSLAGVGSQFFTLGGAIAGVGIGALAFDLAKTGAEAKRYSIALDQVIQNTDLTTQNVDTMRKALEEANVVGGQADAVMLAFSRTGLATLKDEAGNLAVNFDDLLLRTKDLSASMGISSEKGVNALIKAIATGNVQMLDQLGVQINLIATNKAYAESIGKNVSELTLQERQLAIINEVMRQGESVAGTYTSVYDEMEKALSSTSDRMREAKEALSVIIEPAIKAGVVALRDAFASLRDWANQNQESLKAFGQRIAEIVPILVEGLLGALQFLLAHKEIIIAFFTAIAISIGAFLVTLVLAHATAILIFTGLVLLLTLLFTAWNKNFLGIQTITKAVISFIVSLVKGFVGIIQGLWAFLQADTQTKWTMIKTLMINLFTSAYQGVLTVAKKIVEAIKNAIQAVKDFILGKISDFYNWGRNIGNALVDGFWNALSALKQKAIDAINSAKSVLQGKSPPKEGPFKEIDQWGFNVGQAWAQGIAEGARGINLTGPTIEQGSLNAGVGNTTVTINFNGNFMGSETEMREFAMGIWDRVGQMAKSQNKQPNELLDLTI